MYHKVLVPDGTVLYRYGGCRYSPHILLDLSTVVCSCELTQPSVVKYPRFWITTDTVQRIPGTQLRLKTHLLECLGPPTPTTAQLLINFHDDSPEGYVQRTAEILAQAGCCQLDAVPISVSVTVAAKPYVHGRARLYTVAVPLEQRRNMRKKPSPTQMTKPAVPQPSSTGSPMASSEDSGKLAALPGILLQHCDPVNRTPIVECPRRWTVTFTTDGFRASERHQDTKQDEGETAGCLAKKTGRDERTQKPANKDEAEGRSETEEEEAETPEANSTPTTPAVNGE